ncbi:MAG TPA: nitrilase family protein [Polyangia bacterium]|nr:nitrilase family protein [Polyangia bacterium]
MTLPTSDLRVSLVQADTRWHDAAGNRALYGELVRALKGLSDLIVLPEMFTTGFTNQTAGNVEGMDGESLRWFAALAAEVGCVVTGSMILRDAQGPHGPYSPHGPDGPPEQDRCYNRLIWMRPDGSFALYDKRHLFRMTNEHQHFGDGKARLLVDLNGWRICPMVCYDLRFPVWIRNRFGAEAAGRFDYDLLIFVANWPAARRHAWRTLLRARAIENLSYCIGVNRVGKDGNGHEYVGDSAVLDFLGEPMVECGHHPQVVMTTLSAAALAHHRERFPAYLDADDFTLRV